MANPLDFARQHLPLALATGQRLGVSPDILLGQWGLETGWGKSVIPGTNNLGNIKDFSGSGVAATDNVTGSTDKYRAFQTPEGFSDHYASLIERKYPDAVGVGDDPVAYARALMESGYAEDPGYIDKIAAVTNTVRRQPGVMEQIANFIVPAAQAGTLPTEKTGADMAQGNDPWAEAAQEFGMVQPGAASDADPWSQAAQEFSPPSYQEQYSDNSGDTVTLTYGSKPEPGLVEQAVQGAGNFSLGVGRGLRDVVDGGAYLLPKGLEAAASIGGLAPNVVSEYFGGQADRVSDINQQAEREYQDATRGSTAAGIGRVGGGVATAFVPGVAPMKGAAGLKSAMTTGAKLGALTGTRTNEDSLIGNAALGAGVGALGSGVSHLVRPVQSSLSGEAARLLDVAKRYGIDLNLAQRTGSKPLQVADAVMDNLPATAGRNAAFKEAQQLAFNKAVASTFGSTNDALTPATMQEARKRIGNQFTKLASRNNMQFTDDTLTALANLSDEVKRFAPRDVARPVLNRIDEIVGRVSKGSISGKAYRQIDSTIGRTMRSTSNGDLRNYLGQVRSILRSAMDESISPADQAAWRLAREQYGNLMTVAPLAARNETGDVSARALLGAVNRGSKSAAFTGGGNLGEVARMGRAFVADTVPNSGTAQRQLMQNMAIGNGINSIPGLALASGALARPVQWMMQSPTGQRLATEGLTALPLLGRPLEFINPALVGLLGRGQLGAGSRGLLDMAFQ